MTRSWSSMSADDEADAHGGGIEDGDSPRSGSARCRCAPSPAEAIVSPLLLLELHERQPRHLAEPSLDISFGLAYEQRSPGRLRRAAPGGQGDGHRQGQPASARTGSAKTPAGIGRMYRRQDPAEDQRIDDAGTWGGQPASGSSALTAVRSGSAQNGSISRPACPADGEAADRRLGGIA